jgi:hypothetical protein
MEREPFLEGGKMIRRVWGQPLGRISARVCWPFYSLLPRYQAHRCPNLSRPVYGPSCRQSRKGVGKIAGGALCLEELF